MHYKQYPALYLVIIVCVGYLLNFWCEFNNDYMLFGISFVAVLLSFLMKSSKARIVMRCFALIMIVIIYFRCYNGFPTAFEFLESRVWFVDKAQYFNDPRNYALLKSLIIGDRRLLDISLKESFRTTGCFHLIAISGLHFGILAVILHTAFKRVPYVVRFCIVGTILSVYLLIVGFPASAVRAFIMLVVYYIGKIFFIRTYILNIWAIATITMLLVNPSYFNHLGFWLSVVSTLGIIGVLPILKTTRNIIVQSFIVSVAAQCALLPIILHFFGYVNYLSIILNVVASFLIIPIAWIGFLFFFPLPVFFTKVLVYIDEKITSVFFFFIESFEREELLISSKPWGMHWFILYYSGWIVLQWLIYRKYVVKKGSI